MDELLWSVGTIMVIGASALIYLCVKDRMARNRFAEKLRMPCNPKTVDLHQKVEDLKKALKEWQTEEDK